MDKLMLISILLLSSFSSIAQENNLRKVILSVLNGGKENIPVNWEDNNEALRIETLKILESLNDEYTLSGLHRVIKRATDLGYNSHSDSILLNIVFESISKDSIFVDGDYLRNNFKKSDYNQGSYRKLAYYSQKQSILNWKSYTPYYLSFLEIEGIDSTLVFLKENIDAINQLHFSIYNIAYRYDTIDINVCLARLGKMSDTIVIAQINKQFNSHYRKDYRDYFERLSRIRTPLAFQKIGDYLISDLDEIKSEGHRKQVKQMALAAFLAYVKNFPDRSTKWQDTFNLWTMVQYSQVHGKDYSTDEYMDMAKRWYTENKDNLVLDFDKY